MPAAGVSVPPADCHAVTFYDDEQGLVSAVVDFGLPALRDGGVLLLVATPAHNRAFDAALQAAGIDTATARAEQRLLVLDAATTLASFCHDGVLDPAGFEHTIGELIETAGTNGHELRAYGEMVALLWGEGQVTSAIELEEMWNRLQCRMSFGLLCGYPASQTSAPEVADDVRTVGELHTDVRHGPESYVESRSFAADPVAPYRARAFVIETLRSWRCDSLLDDAVLVVSELATNAVMHSRTDFTVRLHRDAHRVRIAVRDGNDAEPTPAVAAELAIGGRGLTLVASVSDGWGCEPVQTGKTVWAEFASHASA